MGWAACEAASLARFLLNIAANSIFSASGPVGVAKDFALWRAALLVVLVHSSVKRLQGDCFDPLWAPFLQVVQEVTAKRTEPLALRRQEINVFFHSLTRDRCTFSVLRGTKTDKEAGASTKKEKKEGACARQPPLLMTPPVLQGHRKAACH
jgi:hypothetical protein